MRFDDVNMNSFLKSPFRNCKQLSKLSLYDIQLHKLSKDLLGGMNSLAELSITCGTGKKEDQLKYIEVGAFDDLRKLKKLSITSCSIPYLQKEAFRGLEKLETLHFSSSIKNVSEDIFKDTANIKEFSIYNSGSKKLVHKRILQPLRNVEKFTMSSIDLSELNPDEIKGLFSNMKKLKVLDFQVCELMLLAQDTFQDLQELTSLVMQQNQLMLLPNDIFTPLVSLQSLDLSNNKIESLPESLKDTNISSLLIEANKISDL